MAVCVAVHHETSEFDPQETIDGAPQLSALMANTDHGFSVGIAFTQ
jgi:hypothetical protein